MIDTQSKNMINWERVFIIEREDAEMILIQLDIFSNRTRHAYDTFGSIYMQGNLLLGVVQFIRT